MDINSLRMEPNPEMGAHWLDVVVERQQELDRQSRMQPPNIDMIKLLTESVHWAEREASYHFGQTIVQDTVGHDFEETA